MGIEATAFAQFHLALLCFALLNYFIVSFIAFIYLHESLQNIAFPIHLAVREG